MWRLNEYCPNEFYIPYNVTGCTETNLAIGNFITVEFDNGLPMFGGIIDFPRRRNSDGVSITAYNAERLFETMDIELNIGAATPGAIFAAAIDAMNEVDPTGIVMGNVYAGGSELPTGFRAQNAWNIITSTARNSGNEFYVYPDYENGLLTFRANWYAKMGRDVTHLVRLDDSDIENLNEQGPVYTRVIVYGSGASWSDKNDSGPVESDNPKLYGLKRQLQEVLATTNLQSQIDAIAARRIAQYQEPSHRISATLSAYDSRLHDFFIGDTVKVESFVAGGDDWAIFDDYRVYAISFDGESCKLELGKL